MNKLESIFSGTINFSINWEREDLNTLKLIGDIYCIVRPLGIVLFNIDNTYCSLSDFKLIQSCGNEIIIKNFKMCWNSSMDSLEKIEQQEMESTKHNVQYLGDDSKRRKISFY